MRVKDKVALVTGGAGGIGASSARLLAGEGAKVIVADLDEAGGRKVAGEIGGTFVRLDVAVFDQWQAALDSIIAEHGRIDVLAHCAGIEGGYLEAGLAMSEEAWNRVIAVNLTGSFLGCKAVFPQMLKQGKGSVILVASCVSDMATSSGLAYGASKAGMTQLARSFAAIGWKNGNKVRCNSVHPGPIKTRMTDTIFSELAQAANMNVSDMEAAIKATLPLGDRGVPDDIGYMILYLASDESAYASGSKFVVDGGWTVVDAG